MHQLNLLWETIVGPNLVTRFQVIFRLKLQENVVINIRLVRLFAWEWPKVGRGTAK